MQPRLSGDFIQWRAGSDYTHTRTLTYIYRCIKKKANSIVPVGRLYDSLKCASHLLTATFWEVQSCVCVGRSDVSESLRCCRKPCSFHTSSGRTNQNPSACSAGTSWCRTSAVKETQRGKITLRCSSKKLSSPH